MSSLFDPQPAPEPKLKAIETEYAGCLFRSRLEARWAVFFESLDIPWEYEPQGYELPSGRYLPDFLLPDIRTYFEVKPSLPNGTHGDSRWGELASATGDQLIVAFGMPSISEVRFGPFETYTSNSSSRHMEVWHTEYGWDIDYAFCICVQCYKIGIEYVGRSERICGHKDYGDKVRTYDHPIIMNAYIAAHSARFEHGQSGPQINRLQPRLRLKKLPKGDLPI